MRGNEEGDGGRWDPQSWSDLSEGESGGMEV